MMAVLLLRLAGPLQSWGTRSRFTDRDTERFPSKSGVIGLLCAALGRPRSEGVDDLAALRLGVRADLPGRLESDFHVTQDVPQADGSGHPRTLPSLRHYLADAVFLAGLEGDAALLAELADRLQRPVWPLFLGRKSCPPSLPVWLPDGLTEQPLEPALREYAWLPGHGWLRDEEARRQLLPWRADHPQPYVEQTAALLCELETGLDDPAGQARWDQPVGPLGERRFALRRVRHESWPHPAAKGTPCT